MVIDFGSDEAILAASLAEPARFAAVFERRVDGTYRYLSFRVGGTIAEDLTSETFARAFAGRRGYKPDRCSVRAWLFGIATNLVRDHRRDELRRIEMLARADAEPAGCSTDSGMQLAERLHNARTPHRTRTGALVPARGSDRLRHKSTARRAGLLSVVLVASLVLVSIAVATRSTRTPVHAGAVTDASCTTGIPVMSGYYFDSRGIQHGFVYNRGKFTTINDPSATTVKKYAGTAVYGVSNDGTVGGSYNDSKGVSHGFIEKAGKFTTINDPSAGAAAGQGTAFYGMNDLGIISGWFMDSTNVVNGFEDVAGTFTTFSDPNAGTTDDPGNYLESADLGTEFLELNDGGVLPGEYIDSKGVAHGVEEIDGRYVTVDDPSAANVSGEGSTINDVNNLGVIVGEYFDSQGFLHGFVDQRGKFTTTNDPNATPSGGTEALAIDNEGVVIGDYNNSSGVEQGYVDIGGKFTTINDPNAGTASGQGTTPEGMPLSLCP